MSVLRAASWTADLCLKCNICTAACPVKGVTELFMGPKAVGPQAERFRHPRLPIPEATVSWCSGCGMCTLVCPQGVAVAEMNIQAKGRLAAQHGVPFRDQLISRPALLGKFGVPLARWANPGLRAAPLRWVLEKMLRISRRAPLPSFAEATFVSRHRERRMAVPPEESENRLTVAYFHGCSTNYYEPELGDITIRVLEALGCRVVLPPQECCGLPLQSNGLFKAARRSARSNVSDLLPFAQAEVPIVGTSTSCMLALKHEYRAVLGLKGSEAEAVSAACWDVFEFIENQLGNRIAEATLDALPMRALYHAPCQLRSHGIGAPAHRVLRRIPGLELVLSGALCCGAAGTYGLKTERYTTAYEVGEPLFRQALESGAEVVITDSETCRWWIEEHSGLPAIHPIELLGRALGVAPVMGSSAGRAAA